MIDLKQHNFPYDSFIGGWYIPEHICDGMLDYYYQKSNDITPGVVGNLQDDRGTQTKISSGSLNENHFYSGSVRYQLSFLDKDHTIITDLNKEGELFDGVGSKEIILIPNNLKPEIRNNLDFYIQQASAVLGINDADTGPILYAPESPMM